MIFFFNNDHWNVPFTDVLSKKKRSHKKKHLYTRTRTTVKFKQYVLAKYFKCKILIEPIKKCMIHFCHEASFCYAIKKSRKPIALELVDASQITRLLNKQDKSRTNMNTLIFNQFWLYVLLICFFFYIILHFFSEHFFYRLTLFLALSCKFMRWQ